MCDGLTDVIYIVFVAKNLQAVPANEDDDDEDADDNTSSTSEGEKFSGSDTESDENDSIKNAKGGPFTSTGAEQLLRVFVYRFL